MTPRTEATPTTDCHHTNVVTMTGANYGVDVGVYLWACADCRVRLYPACPVCVDVGHRNVAHVDIAAKVRADLIELVDKPDDDALANAIYVGVVNPDLTWWDDLTPDMQEAYRAGARSVRRHLAALLRDDKEAGGG